MRKQQVGAWMVGDNVTDDAPAIQAALDAAASSGGGTVCLGAATYAVGSPLFVPSYVTLRGQGMQATRLRAIHGVFPQDTALVTLGSPSDTYGFQARAERLTVDAYAVPGSTCVWSTKAQEGAGLHLVLCQNYLRAGAYFGSVAENFQISESWFFCHTSAPANSTDGISLYVVPWCSISRCSIVTGGASWQSNAIKLNMSRAVVSDVHIEKHARGIYSHNNSRLTATGVNGLDCTNLIQLSPPLSSHAVIVNAVGGRSIESVLKNTITGEAFATDVTFYATK